MTEITSSLQTCNNGPDAFTERSASFGIRRALLVGHNNYAWTILKILLQQFGFDVAESENGLSGMKRFHDGEKYDVVIINRYMPIMNGLQATHLLRNMGFMIKIVGICSDDCHEEFLEAGADAFQIIPMDRIELAALLEAIGLIN
ncbi:two-component response regulator ORR41-like isoform X2 [Carex rostrata]